MDSLTTKGTVVSVALRLIVPQHISPMSWRIMSAAYVLEGISLLRVTSNLGHHSHGYKQSHRIASKGLEKIKFLVEHQGILVQYIQYQAYSG